MLQTFGRECSALCASGFHDVRQHSTVTQGRNQVIKRGSNAGNLATLLGLV